MDAQGEGTAQTSFTVPSIVSEREVMDLSNSLNSLSGIEHVAANPADHTVSITYDTAYIDRDSLKEFIRRTGYPVEG